MAEESGCHPEAQTGCEAPAEVYSQSVPRNWFLRGALEIAGLGVLALAVFFMVVRFLLPLGSDLYPMAFCLGLFIGGTIFIAPLRSQHARAEMLAGVFAECFAPNTAESVLEDAVRRRPAFTDFSIFRHLARNLADSGRRNIVLRLSRSDPVPDVTPIEDSFEARVLDDSDPAFEELYHAATGADDDRDPRHLSGDQPLAKRLRRLLKSNGGSWLFCVMMIGVIICLVGELSSGGRLSSMSYVFIGVVMLSVFVPSPRAPWHIVPGGVYVGRRWRSSQLIFKRIECVTVLVETSGRGCWMHIFNGREKCEMLFTRKEADLLLRGWLSPAPTPEVGQVERLVLGAESTVKPVA